jgi:hypothetical protein
LVKPGAATSFTDVGLLKRGAGQAGINLVDLR